MNHEESIRRAVLEDGPAIARVHVESWRTTYKGIFPESVLDQLSVPARTRFWNETLAKPPDRFVTLVACDEVGRLVGFVCGGAERSGELGCDGELQALYLLKGSQRQGLGTLLVRRFVHELRLVGFHSMAVWVLARNPSRRFYEVLGGKLITEQQIERSGESYVEIAYGWSDLSEFPASPSSAYF
ncbi:MAG TPA: GNAT family N-acetyltransferase [Candidatus Acidoferrum sp.]|nr:GNAT family N-acetyltransferase [Candidatus Acidoferrum sp.]